MHSGCSKWQARSTTNLTFRRVRLFLCLSVVGRSALRSQGPYWRFCAKGAPYWRLVTEILRRSVSPHPPSLMLSKDERMLCAVACFAFLTERTTLQPVTPLRHSSFGQRMQARRMLGA